jgi:hypothetical protein
MKNLCAAMGIAILCSTGAAIAQAPAPKEPAAKDQTAADKKMKEATVSVTGCVAQGADATHYVLNNATMTPAAKTGTASKEMPADHPMMSYTLNGGELKPHVGHKVEVSGTIEKESMGMDAGKMGTMSDKSKPGAADKMGKTGSTEMASGALKVKSVKMLSTTCP